MKQILTIALKDARLLLRDPRSAVILLIMPLLMILVLGLSLGEGFGRKSDDKVRISVVNEDEGLPPDSEPYPGRRWSEVVLEDLANTGNIRVELFNSRAEAQAMLDRGRRSSVIVFEPDFSRRAHRCSFIGEPFKNDPINPLDENGMRIHEVGVTILHDKAQLAAYSVTQQVTQVSLMRVIIPWMIGQAFEQIGNAEFMKRMERDIPVLKGAYLIISRDDLGKAMQNGIKGFFKNYNFTAKTWAGLTNKRAAESKSENLTAYSSDGIGTLKRGAIRYQILVPTYVVSFAFFLVLTVGWLFVAERRHGTLVRLRAAPLSAAKILIGKVLPCYAISIIQGFFLLVAGKIVFDMSWGSQPWMLIPTVLCTSLAAVGLAMLVAAIAKTETQVAVYGTLLVLVLAGVSGTLMPRDFLSEDMRAISQFTPQSWALDAYLQLLVPDVVPDLMFMAKAWLVLAAFGCGFLALAGWLLKLD